MGRIHNLTILRGRRPGCAAPLLLALLAPAVPSRAQIGDPAGKLVNWLTTESEGKLKISGEIRGRYESRTGNAFGREPDRDYALYRTRLGVAVKPVKWLKASAMVQDSRSPWYGDGAPSSVRDPADLQEAYIELFPDSKRGFGMTLGRMMLNYGETRLIASPQWGNINRSWDHARAYYRFPGAQVEVLFLSPVKVRIGEFNRPVAGERVWGTYNVFPKVRGNLVEVYLLRHDQNRIAGFTGGSRAAGTDRLGVTSYGARLAGPAAFKSKYSVEGVVQTGSIGPATHRAAAWHSGITRRWRALGKPLDVSGEYKFASGTRNPSDTTRVATFDPLFPSAHDKFGHQDLFGWRNIHAARSLATMALSSKLSLNAMYTSSWLFSARDGLYNSSGKVIVRSAAGTAGRHAGQEADVFATVKLRQHVFGAGFGRFFAGGFVRATSPGAGPGFLYISHGYSF